MASLFIPVLHPRPASPKPGNSNPSIASAADQPNEPGPCGLPATYAGFTSTATTKTFNLTDDCYFNPWAVAEDWPFLRFESGTFTINGNGHSIIGPSNGYAIIVGLPTADTNTVLNLNDITIREAGREDANTQAVIVQRGATLNGRNVIFRDNVGAGGALRVFRTGKAYLEDVQFLNNEQTYSGTANRWYAASVQGLADPAASTVLSITNGIFEGNTGGLSANEMVISATGATLQLQGCIIFRNNEGVNYRGIETFFIPGIVIDNSDSSHCPRPKKEKVPTSTATFRPPAATCIDLNLASGIVVHATYGLGSGVQRQRLDGGGIGVPAIVEAGFIDAVDVWGYVEQGVEVCFPQAGELLFLDARTMPRAVAPLAAYTVNGMTCGAIDSPGSIVLMPLP